jgi:hypothetical protein
LQALALVASPRLGLQQFLTMVKKTLDLHVFSNLASIATISYSYDLWMSKGNVNTFALVINFLNEF